MSSPEYPVKRDPVDILVHGLSYTLSHWTLTTPSISFTPTFFSEEMRLIKEALIKLTLDLERPIGSSSHLPGPERLGPMSQ